MREAQILLLSIVVFEDGSVLGTLATRGVRGVVVELAEIEVARYTGLEIESRSEALCTLVALLITRIGFVLNTFIYGSSDALG